MQTLDLIAVLISLTAAFAFITHRFTKLPVTIGVMLISVLASAALLGLDAVGVPVAEPVTKVVEGIDFYATLMNGMLSFLLFAGAMHVKLDDLFAHRWSVGVLASVGVVCSTFLIGTLMWWVLGLLGLPLPYLFCLVFGSLITPTDPIAVLAILKSAGASKELETNITGESLFNDGVAVVVFIVLSGIAVGGQELDAVNIATLFAEEALGGVGLGLVLGYGGYFLMRSVDNYQVEVLLTIALVMGGYSLALALHFSGPIAMVVAGLIIGNRARSMAMNDTTREYLDKFWEMLDEILNAVLFLLIGIELLVISFTGKAVLAGLIAIPLVLVARFICVGFAVNLIKPVHRLPSGAIRILTWAGLRGGISVALALSLPESPERNLIVTITYCVVLFSIVVQGLTVGRVVKALS